MDSMDSSSGSETYSHSESSSADMSKSNVSLFSEEWSNQVFLLWACLVFRLAPDWHSTRPVTMRSNKSKIRFCRRSEVMRHVQGKVRRNDKTI